MTCLMASCLTVAVRSALEMAASFLATIITVLKIVGKFAGDRNRHELSDFVRVVVAAQQIHQLCSGRFDSAVMAGDDAGIE